MKLIVDIDLKALAAEKCICCDISEGHIDAECAEYLLENSKYVEDHFKGNTLDELNDFISRIIVEETK